MTLSSTLKEAVILKALDRGPGVTLKSIAIANNIGESTLGKWLTQSRTGTNSNQSNNTSREGWLSHLINTNGMDDVSLGTYCRKHGIYSHQLPEWKKELMTPKNDNNKQNQELKKLKEENKNLQRELKRKDKALAEASALLILKKKADLIWGVDEDDS